MEWLCPLVLFSTLQPTDADLELILCSANAAEMANLLASEKPCDTKSDALHYATLLGMITELQLLIDFIHLFHGF